MTTRNLSYFFDPKSVALIGASGQAGSLGAVLVRNLLHGALDAPVFAVNPKREHVFTLPAYPDVASIPQIPELAVVATPPETVPMIVSQLAEKGTKAVVVITAGFSEDKKQRGHQLEQAMLDAAQPHLLRIIGPNCLGIMVPHVGLNASFAKTEALPGKVAFVTQSGAVATAVVDWARERGIGFSHVVSLGDMSDVDFGDMLDYLALDRSAKAVLLYVEAITDARKFMSAARAASRVKPVIVVKVGRSAAGARAAASHTGSMAGSDEVYEAAFRRAGILRVSALDELFEAAETLSKIEVPAGDRLAILTNGGGAGVLATDALDERGGRLAELEPETFAALDAVLPPTWSHGNPIDIIGDAGHDRYEKSLDIVLRDRSVDAVLVLSCPTAMASGEDAARAVIETASRKGHVPVLTNWLGGESAAAARRMFSENRIPTFDTPHAAVRAFMHLVDYRRGQVSLMETPASVPVEFKSDTQRARRVIEGVLEEGRDLLTEPEAKEVLEAYAIPTTRTLVAHSPKEAADSFARFDGPVVLKILSREISHKSDVGGVVLGLNSAGEVEAAALAMADRVARVVPGAAVDGFVVQEMIARPDAYELIVGVSEDAQFGPTIMVGQGGTAVELIDDTVLGLPPLNLNLAREMIASTRIHKLLKGFRDKSPVDLEAVDLTLLKVSQLVVDIGEVKELDINPLLVDRDGVIALDARIGVARTTDHPHRRLAIKPYPKELEENVELDDGRRLFIRPIRAEDEPSLRASFDSLAPEKMRMRFFAPMKSIDRLMAARLSQINYDREMALVLTSHGSPGTTEIFGVARISADPNNERAEYALFIRDDMAGQGLGTALLQRILTYARSRGIVEIFGDVLRENTAMLALCDDLGFAKSLDPEDPSIIRTTIAP